MRRAAGRNKYSSAQMGSKCVRKRRMRSAAVYEALRGLPNTPSQPRPGDTGRGNKSGGDDVSDAMAAKNSRRTAMPRLSAGSSYV